jgi:CxxC-x17-CxxC domain-containing protein
MRSQFFSSSADQWFSIALWRTSPVAPRAGQSFLVSITFKGSSMIKMDLQLQDTTVTCSQCGQEFTFTAGEQFSYARRGQSKPTQCAFCRAAGMIAGGVRSGSSGDREGHGERGARGERSEHVMYAAVCAQCGKQTKVPFEPRSSRPVYCSSCYQDQQRTSGGYSGGARGRSGYGKRG